MNARSLDDSEPSCTLDELIAELRQYPPSDVLFWVRKWSDGFEKYIKVNANEPLLVKVPRRLSYLGLDQEIAVTHHVLAMLAKLSLLNGSRLAPGSLTQDRFLRLLRKAAELSDPVDKGNREMMIFREVSKQAPYQEDLWSPIPRALLTYLDAAACVRNPEFDIDAQFKAHSGLDVKTFLALGFLLFATFKHAHAFFPLGGWHAKAAVVRDHQILTPDNKKALLGLVAADQARFKQESTRLSASGTGNDQFDWNVLFKYPCIDIGDGNHVLPIRRLLIYRLEDAPFYELADLQREGKGNSFRTFFGKVFQEYVGLLLKDAFPSKVRHEAGRPPVDWLLRVNDAALLIECRISEFTVPTKSSGDASRVQRDVERIILETVKKLPEKKNFLREHASDFGLDGVQNWHYLVVVRKPLLPVPLVREWIDGLLASPVPYHLLSIHDLEQLLALKEHGVDRIMADKESAAEISKEFRSFFHERRGQYHYGRNPLLQRAHKSFLDEMFGLGSD